MKKHILLFLTLIMSMMVTAQVTIQMEKDGGVYKVPCTVNGVKMKFVFDTGASTVCISQSMAQFLMDGGYLSVDDIVGTGQSFVADGSSVNHIEIVLRDVEIGGMHIHNVDATVIEGQNAPLLLGQSAISELGRITIEGNTLCIHAADNGLSEEQITQLGEQAQRYIETGSYAAAIENLTIIDRAIGLSENRLIGLGYCYYQNLQFEQCVQSCKRWINEFERTSKRAGNKYGTCYLIALSYYNNEERKNYDNALLYFQKTLDVLETEDVISGDNGLFSFENKESLIESKSIINWYIGRCYFLLENYSKALPFYQSAIVLRSNYLNTSLDKVQNGMVQDETLGHFLYDLALCYYKLNRNSDINEPLKLSALCGNTNAIDWCRSVNINYRKKSRKSFDWWID